jgi:hypothetical protein
MRVGVTGHINLGPSSAPLVYDALAGALRRYRSVHGVTCLATGADQLFAAAVRDCCGTYELILPGQRGAVRAPPWLLHEASAVSYVTPRKTGEAAYAAASDELLRRCDQLFAVWDGSYRGRPGGTAQTVARARRMGIPVTVIWPAGAARR